MGILTRCLQAFALCGIFVTAQGVWDADAATMDDNDFYREFAKRVNLTAVEERVIDGMKKEIEESELKKQIQNHLRNQYN